MRVGAKPAVRTLALGAVLFGEGDAGQSLFLLFDGVVSVEAGGKVLAALGRGTLVGERDPLECGPRAATLTVVTPIRVAEQIDRSALEWLSEGHRREEGVPTGGTLGRDLAAATLEPASSGDTSLGSA
jgi:CRP-like cAMP-binding protein